MTVNQIASAVLNDLFSGNLIPTTGRSLISLEQLEDEVIETRSAIIQELFLKNVLRKEDVLTAINSIPVDCSDQNKNSCNMDIDNKKLALHFEIPQLVGGLGKDSIYYIGSTDRSNSFKIYYNREAIKYQKYKKNRKNIPYVYVEKTPNKNGMFDCWVFNAPFLKYVTVIGIFKDLRQLDKFECCLNTDYLEMGMLSAEVKNRLLTKKVQIYRAPVTITPQTI